MSEGNSLGVLEKLLPQDPEWGMEARPQKRPLTSREEIGTGMGIWGSQCGVFWELGFVSLWLAADSFYRLPFLVPTALSQQQLTAHFLSSNHRHASPHLGLRRKQLLYFFIVIRSQFNRNLWQFRTNPLESDSIRNTGAMEDKGWPTSLRGLGNLAGEIQGLCFQESEPKTRALRLL